MATLEISDDLFSRIQQRAESEGLSLETWLSQQVNIASPTDAALASQHNRTRWRTIFDHARDMMLLVNDHAEFVEVNPVACQLLGYTRDELLGKTIWDITPRPDQASGRMDWQTFIASSEMSGEYALRRKDGSRFTAEFTAVANILPGQHLSILRDITDRKAAEDALRESEARYRTLAAHFPKGMIALYDHDLCYTVVNGEGLGAIGLRVADLQGKRLRDVFPPEVYERDEPALIAALNGEETEQVVEFAGEIYHIQTLPVRDEQGNIINGMVVSQTITSIKESERQHQELLQQLELAIRTANLGVWQFDVASGKLIWNEQLHAIYGISPQAFAENMDAWRDRVHPDDRAQAEQSLEEIFRTGHVRDVRYRIIWPDGDIRYIDASGTAVYDSQGEITKLIGINRDMTDYERSKQALATSEARYRALFDGALNPIVVYDEEARIVMANAFAAREMGRSPQDLIGVALRDFLPDMHDRTVERIRQVLTTGEPLHVQDNIQTEYGEYWFWSVIQPLPDGIDAPRGVQVITYDMTEQKQAQQFEAERIRLRAELEREQSLSALRTRLLSLISHEFRTPLTIMLSATELLTKYGDRLPADVRMAKIAGIAEQVQHLAHLLDEINKLTIANRGFLDYRPEQTDIALLCQLVFNTMSQLLTPHHTLALDLPQGDLSAVLDKTLMQHALTNLIGNAIKYSPQGGAICLRVRQADDVWHFSVTDEGMGIPPEDQTDLFKPFSRASNVGQIRGTGLGLSIVQEVAQQHAGYVTVESRVDVGSTFTMAIPSQTGASDGLHSDH